MFIKTCGIEIFQQFEKRADEEKKCNFLSKNWKKKTAKKIEMNEKYKSRFFNYEMLFLCFCFIYYLSTFNTRPALMKKWLGVDFIW